jgi:preprotein translocase subunit YajC
VFSLYAQSPKEAPTDALIAASSSSSGSSTALLISLGLMVVIFYFLLIRPQRRRAMAQRDLVESLGVGDDVVTVGGMFGTIRAQDDESVTVEVAPGTNIRMLKSAILRKAYADDIADTTVPDEEPGETS